MPRSRINHTPHGRRTLTFDHQEVIMVTFTIKNLLTQTLTPLRLKGLIESGSDSQLNHLELIISIGDTTWNHNYALDNHQEAIKRGNFTIKNAIKIHKAKTTR